MNPGTTTMEKGFATPAAGDYASDDPIELVENGHKLIKFPDGSAYLGEDQDPNRDYQIDADKHDQNLAEVLPPDVVNKIGFTLKSAIEDDIESQSAYFEAVSEAIRLLGLDLSNESDREDAPFKGASGIYSTAFFESALDLLASAVSSLYPSQGMVDSVINGNSSPELEDQAYRKKAWFNYYLTQVAKEFKKEGKRALFWAIVCGSIYKKVFIDPTLGRPTSMFIRPEDFIVNREYATHLAASRKTHILHMSARDLQLRRMSGMYCDIDVMPDDQNDRTDQAIQDQLNAISGIESEGYTSELDDKYVLYECHVDLYIEEDPTAPRFELPMPYIITLDSTSGDVLAIRRNWDKQDFLKKKKEYFVNYSLLPSLDGEGYGLVHYAGHLAESATAITRQLINAGTYANFPGGVYAAGIRIENNNLRPAPSEFVPIQTGGLPIDQVISPLPYKEPSPALRDLLSNIEDSIRKPSAIVNQKVAEMTPRAPMGSVLAMLESLQKVPNAILQGFHESFQQELMLLNDRFADWMPDNQPYPFMVPGGEHVIMKQDFQDNILVIPASDPSLQNSTYRFMQSEIVLNQARNSPDIHNMRYAYEYFYKNMNLSPEDIHQLLPEPQPEQQPFSGDPITEDQYLLTSKPIRAEIGQDHDAHILVHQLVVNNPQASPESIAAANAHIQEHEGLKLLVEMQAQIGFEMPQDPSQIPPEIQNQIAVAAAQVAQQKLAEMQGAQGQTPPPLDPAVVMDEDSKRKAEIAHERIALDARELEFEAHKAQMDFDLEEMKLKQKQQSDLMKAELEDKKIELDNTAKERDQLLKEVQALHEKFNNQQESQDYETQQM